MNNYNKAELISKKLNLENFEKVRRLTVLSTNNKGITPSCASRFTIQNHKQNIQENQHRSKSKAEQFDELLGGKLAEIYQQKYRDKNNLTPSFISDNPFAGDYNGMHRSLYETTGNEKSQKRNKRVRPNSLMRASNKTRKIKQVKNGKNYIKDYYTQNSLNTEKYNISNNPSITLDSNSMSDANACKSCISNDDKKLIVTANNSYIHNLNIAPDGFACCDPSKGYSNSFASHVDSFLDKKTIETTELDLNKKIFAAEKYDGKAKQNMILKAHEEVLTTISTICPCLEGLINRVKGTYSGYIKSSNEEHEKEIAELKDKILKEENAKLEVLKLELKAKEEEIKKLKPKKKTVNIPKLDFTKLRRSCDEDYDDKPVFINEFEEDQNSIKKIKVPMLKLGNLNKNVGYRDEFLAKAEEFSLSWRKQMEKDKRY